MQTKGRRERERKRRGKDEEGKGRGKERRKGKEKVKGELEVKLWQKWKKSQTPQPGIEPCTALYRNPIQVSKFGSTFGQLFL